MKKLTSVCLAALLTASVAQFDANAVGWPAGYEGVMLQSFHWEEDDTPADQLGIRWTDLTNRVDEIAGSFDLIWVPNSAKGGSTLGYLPIYWFTNHNTKMGTEAEFHNMVATYKAHGTGFIADVIVNHRQGVTGWYDFPEEEWNGRTWQMGLNDIVSDDELKDAADQPDPTGNPDEGELPCTYCRDLDHKGANVQESVRNYMVCLKEKYGYVGFRYDYMRGFDGRRITDYNQYSHPTFSVGEFWDSSYDNVQTWIERTGRESAAFDFPFKYALNAAFNGDDDDMTKLVWNANGVTPQPAGMIHYGYAQYAVTFIDNHDSFRDEFHQGNGFSDTYHIPAANAFMLCSPGTPCVFINHWNDYKSEISKMIAARKLVGVSNTSKVTVLRTNKNCYMAEVIGSKGRLVVKIGSEMTGPDSSLGYGEPYCSGNDYCIWVKTTGGEPATGQSGNLNVPSTLYVVGTLKDAHWNTNAGIKFNSNGHKFTANNVQLTASDDGKAYFTFVTKTGNDWNSVNKGDRFGAPNKDEKVTVGTETYVKKYFADWNASEGQSWQVEAGVYTIDIDFDSMRMTLTKQGQVDPDPDPDPEPEPEPTTVTLYWDNTKANWATPTVHYWGGTSETKWPGVKMSKVEGNIWVYECPEGTTGCIFNAGDGDATKTGDFTAINYHIYTQGGDISTSKPEHLYMVGTVNGMSWNTAQAVQETKVNNNVYTWEDVTIANTGDDYGYFQFLSKLGKDWDEASTSDRFGATSENREVTPTVKAFAQRYAVNHDVMSSKSWKVKSDTYTVEVDLNKNTVKVYKPVKTQHIIFRDDEEGSDWLVNGEVPSGEDNYDNVYLTIRYGDIDGNSYDAAWSNYQEGENTRFNPGATTNAPKRVNAETPAKISQSDLDAAHVHLDVKVELDNGDNSWKVINPKYEGWDWDEAHYPNGVPDDFYVNQVQAYPTAPGYIRIPLIAKNTAVAVTAKPNSSAQLYDGAPTTVTRNYSFAEGATTAVELPEAGIDDVAPVYYNLQGIRVDNPGRGIYIKVQGQKVSKVSIR